MLPLSRSLLLSYAHDSTSNPDSISARCRNRQPSDPVMRSAMLTAPSSISQKANVSCRTDDDPAGIRSNWKVRRTVSNLSGNLCFHPEFLPQISQIYIDRVDAGIAGRKRDLACGNGSS